ncbi:MAG: EamA family transporter [Clostridia bacterium]|nr:EamA family transporter [Clostridia bacterium]
MKTFFSSWQFFALGSAFFAALTAIFGKIGVTRINSDLATFIRTVVVIVVLALLVTIRGEWKFEHIPRTSLIFLILSAIATGFSWVCYYHALQIGPANRVAPIDKLSVVLVIIFATVFLHEALTWKVALGGLLITAGAIVLAL